MFDFTNKTYGDAVADAAWTTNSLYVSREPVVPALAMRTREKDPQTGRLYANSILKLTRLTKFLRLSAPFANAAEVCPKLGMDLHSDEAE